MNYRFLESEQEHAERLGGNQHRTRQLRRAILHLLTGHKYSELAGYLVKKGPDELYRMAAVRLNGEVLMPYGQPSNREFLEAALGQMMTTADPNAPQRVKLEMLAQGLYQGNIPYPYEGYGGSVTVTPQAETMVLSAFATLQFGSYTDVAAKLNQMGFRTATGRRWNKDTARSFCQNPIHAGYAVTYTDRRPDGSADKRGAMTFTRLTAGMPDPPISIATFLNCNPVMAEREITYVVPEAVA